MITASISHQYRKSGLVIPRGIVGGSNDGGGRSGRGDSDEY